MSEDIEYQSNHPRRQFLRTVAIATVASCATGAGIAVLKPTTNAATVAAVPTAMPTFPPIPTSSSEAGLQAQLSEVWEKLAAAEAENLQLRAELDGTQRRLDAAENNLTLSNEDQRVTLEELEVVRGELDVSAAENIILAGLIGLYEDLSEIDIHEPLTNGLNQIQDAWNDVWDDVPSLQEGIDQVESRLSQFDGDVELFENGRTFVTRQIERFSRFNQSIKSVLSQAQESVGSVLEMLWGWFDNVLSWLPFNFGQSSRPIMENLAELVDELPIATNGLIREVALPMDRWFAQDPDDGTQPIIRAKLFRPIAEETVPQVRSMIEKTNTTQDRFNTELVAQVSPVLAQRLQHEKAIERFKEENSEALSRYQRRV